MSREASYHWSFHSQIYSSSSVSLPPPPKKKNFEQHWDILNLINAARLKKKLLKISEERKFGLSAVLFLRHEE